MTKSVEQADAGCGRRDFLKLGAAGGLGLALGNLALAESPTAAAKARPIDVVRIGMVGMGARGNTILSELLKLEGLEIRAFCDIVESKVAAAAERVVKAGRPKPAAYTRGTTDFRRLCEQEDLDLVYTATPWEWHVPVCLAAMNNGKHAAPEVPAAVTLDECWSLVETVEKTGKYCMMMENCCYDRTELMILNMVRKGLLGELIHAEGGYVHDMRSGKFSKVGRGPWRLPHAEKRNGDLYPTHGLAILAQCMNVNRGNRFVRLVSMGSQSLGLNLYAAQAFGPDSPQAKKHYALSDVVSTLIQTAAGQTISLTHDTDSPHPYSRNTFVQGTKGLVRKYPDEKVFIDGRNRRPGLWEGEWDWEPLEDFRAEYEHPLWKTLADKAKGAGHGGMDFIECYRLIHALRAGTPLDMDVYDAADWSAVSALSARSIAGKSVPVEFPDFTRGKWKDRPPLGIVSA